VARPAPAIGRTIALLNFLTAHPDERFSLSELARRLDMNRRRRTPCSSRSPRPATCCAIRRRSRSPSAPPSSRWGTRRRVDSSRWSTTPGRDAPLERRARGAVRGERGHRRGDRAAGRSGDPEPLGLSVQVGSACPSSATGTVFLAWSGPDEIDRWLRHLGPRGRRRAAGAGTTGGGRRAPAGLLQGLDSSRPAPRLSASMPGFRSRSDELDHR